MQKQSILLIAPSHGTVKIMQKNAKNIPKRAPLGCSSAKKMQKNAKMQKCKKNAKMQKKHSLLYEHFRNDISSRKEIRGKKEKNKRQ